MPFSNYSYGEIFYEYINETSNETLPSADFEIDFSHALGAFLFRYYTPVIVLFGLVGNVLSVIVFLNRKLRKLSSSYYYLIALGISDTCFLLGTLVPWLTFVKVNIYNRNYFCQFFMYISGMCNFLSVWFVVAFTVERFIAVLYPLHRKSVCTLKRVKIILGTLIATSIVFNIPYLFFTAVTFSSFYNDDVCDVNPEYMVSDIVKLLMKLNYLLL